jgi:hypothetical protein
MSYEFELDSETIRDPNIVYHFQGKNPFGLRHNDIPKKDVLCADGKLHFLLNVMQNLNKDCHESLIPKFLQGGTAAIGNFPGRNAMIADLTDVHAAGDINGIRHSWFRGISSKLAKGQ